MLDAGRAWGEYDTVVHAAAMGASTDAALRAGELPAPSPRAIAETERSFRLARRLVSAEDAARWLTSWKVSLDDWRAWIAATLVREERDVTDVPPDELERWTWIEGVCSGAFERWARWLGDRAAVADVTGTDPTGIEELEPVYQAWCEASVTDSALAAEIERRTTDWLRMTCIATSLADPDIAREIVLGVKNDGRTLGEMAKLAHAPAGPISFLLEDADPAVQAALLSTAPGECVGPVAVGDEHYVFAVVSKDEPTSADQDVAARAHRALVLRALAREREERVRWHEPL